jgi:hypothetical protein
MKRTRSGIFAAFACAFAVSVAAQTPPPQEQQPPRPTGTSGAQSNKITVTGCLERSKDTSAPTGTSGSAASDTSKFVLNNITPSAAAPGTAGTSGSTMSKASSYRLDGEDSKLTPHIGHKVEITGTVDNSASATGASMSAASKLKVDSVKMVAATCTP